MMTKKFIQWLKEKHPSLWLRWDVSIHKKHRIEIRNIALGVSDRGNTPLTAWKYMCIVCGDEIIQLTESGVKQLEDGHLYEDVVKFIGE
jgi:hypothetical protein